MRIYVSFISSFALIVSRFRTRSINSVSWLKQRECHSSHISFNNCGLRKEPIRKLICWRNHKKCFVIVGQFTIILWAALVPVHLHCFFGVRLRWDIVKVWSKIIIACSRMAGVILWVKLNDAFYIKRNLHFLPMGWWNRPLKSVNLISWSFRLNFQRQRFRTHSDSQLGQTSLPSCSLRGTRSLWGRRDFYASERIRPGRV